MTTTNSTSTKKRRRPHKRPRQIGKPELRDRLVALVATTRGDKRGEVLGAALEELGYVVDVAQGLRAVHFCERHCRHTKGRYHGKPFLLRPFQFLRWFAFFGCVNEDGSRYFHRCWYEVAKKNGKSAEMAAAADYALSGLGEWNAEVILAASARDQAGEVYKVCADMRDLDPALRKRTTARRSAKLLIDKVHGGKLQAISADANYNDGINPSFAGVDEVHRHKNRDLWDVLRQGQGTRDDPIFWAITTAGAGREGLAWEEHEHARQVIDGTVTDKRLLAVIYAAPEEADWTDPATWRLANPALGDFLREDDLADAIATAKSKPTEEHSIRRLRLNQWVASEVRWLNMAAWDACAGHLPLEDKLKGRLCYMGLDISHSSDFSATALLFPRDDRDDDDEPFYDVLWRFWLPEDSLETTNRKLAPDIRVWAKQGWVKLQPGDAIDQREVQAQVLADFATFNVECLGYDRYHLVPFVSELVERLGDEAMVDVGQTFRHMNAPCKELERILSAGRLNTGGNPVVRYMAGNAVAEVNQDDLVRPSRKKSTSKIDGLVAMLMALERAMHAEAAPEVSFYAFD